MSISGKYRADKFKVSSSNPTAALTKNADLDFGVYLGEIIVRPKDDTHSGRLTVYIPALGKDRDNPSNWVNAFWSTPFGGSTPSNRIGDNLSSYVETQKSYGMWMVPPDVGNWVLVCFADGKSKLPFVIGCLLPDQMANMVPGNAAGKTFGTDQKLPVAEVNKRTPGIDHGNNATRPVNPYITKPILDQGLINDKLRGISSSSARRESPSAVFGISTPGAEDVNLDTGKKDGTHRTGGHSFVMDDGDTNGDSKNIRIRTAGGNQVLMDDTNGLIYVINAKGNAWIEMSGDGDIQIYSEKDISYRAKGNINIRADKNLNLEGNTSVNIAAGVYGEAHEQQDEDGNQRGVLNINAGATANMKVMQDFVLEVDDKGSLHLTSRNSLLATAGRDMHLNAKSNMFSTAAEAQHIKAGGDANIQAGGKTNVVGSTVHLNDGGSATQAENSKTAEALPLTEHEDQAPGLPGWEYDMQDTTEDNPLTTNGDREGNKDTVSSIIDSLLTREPYIGHADKDKPLSS
mgnify:CR=1 FL=1|tara:strand:+ start:1525 stop:3072 length:1548 start_codon:yes stop_codon:yes gene_type:complete